MKTVTIYWIEITQSHRMEEQHPFFSLTPWGEDTDRIKADCTPRDYALPEGYIVEMSKGSELWPSELTIYDSDNRPCDLLVHSSGHPQLSPMGDWGIGRRAPVLTPAGYLRGEIQYVTFDDDPETQIADTVKLFDFQGYFGYTDIATWNEYGGNVLAIHQAGAFNRDRENKPTASLAEAE